MLTIEEILKLAKEMGASDVHLAVDAPPKARVRGKLLSMDGSQMVPGDILDILLAVLSESQRVLFEERGEYNTSFSVPGLGRCRVHAYKQRGQATLSFHLLEAEIPSAEVLGIPEDVLELAQCEKGLIIVAGISGSGRTTTLAALIDEINNSRYSHIVTLENPIEYLHCHKLSLVSQRQIGTDAHSYGTALRAVLREDTDVILVGEMCDAETVSETLTAVETGHLVLSAANSPDAAGALQRLVDFYPAHQQTAICMRLADALEAVISQQLTPAVNGSGYTAEFKVMRADAMVRDLVRAGDFRRLAGF